MSSWVSDAIYSITDPLGLTDRGAADRALAAAREGQQSANDMLEHDTNSQFSMLSGAMAGRDYGANLDRYDTQMDAANAANQEAMDAARGSMNAGSADNVQKYMNPMMDTILGKTTQAVQGGAGAALQSSATNRNIGQTVAQQAGNLWNTAYSQALGDSQNNMKAGQMIGQGAGQQANFAGQSLSNNNMPMNNWIDLANDKAMQRYAGNIGLAQAGTTAAGQSQAIL